MRLVVAHMINKINFFCLTKLYIPIFCFDHFVIIRSTKLNSRGLGQATCACASIYKTSDHDKTVSKLTKVLALCFGYIY